MDLGGTKKKLPRDGNVRNMSSPQILANISSINLMSARLRFENSMYQKQVVKVGLDAEFDQALGLVASAQHALRMRQTSGAREQTRYVRLKDEYKCKIAREYLDELARDYAEKNRICESIICNYKITKEDLDLSMNYLKKQRYQLQRRVVPLLRDPSKMMQAHHAFMHFHSIVLKDMDAVKEKLRITNKNLLKKLENVRQFLKEHARSKVMIQAVDFEEQQIQAVQASRRILELKNLVAMQKTVAARLTISLEKIRGTLNEELNASQEMEKRLSMMLIHHKLLCSSIEKYREGLQGEYNELIAAQQRYTNYVPTTADLINRYSKYERSTWSENLADKKLRRSKSGYEQHQRIWDSTKRGL